MSTGIYLLFCAVFITNCHFLVWSYERFIVEGQNYMMWVLVNATVGFLSWLFFYRDILDGQQSTLKKE
jgi:uncharacterized membrane protein